MSTRGKRVLILLVAILALGAGGLALAAFNGDPTPEEILTHTVETLDAAQDGHAVLHIEADTPDKSGSATVEVWGKKPADENADAHPKFRAEVLETSEPEAEDAVAVSDGAQVWFYAPARNTVWTGAVEEMHDQHADDGDKPSFDSPQELVDWLLQVSDVTLLGTETVTDQAAYKLQFVPDPEELPEAAAAGATGTAWIEPARWLPRQATFDGGSMGQGRVTAELVELDVGLPDDLFTFQIPDGAEVVPLENYQPQHLSLDEAEAAVDFDLLTPSEVPEGATLIDVMKVKDTVVLRYEAARGSFAVSQGVDERDVEQPSTPGKPVSLRGTTGTLFTNEEGTKVFLVWTEGERTFTVSGAISGEQALRIAESLQ